ncbi:hypothetical protein MRX96_057840 [Rhipicephalus microplus]
MATSLYPSVFFAQVTLCALAQHVSFTPKNDNSSLDLPTVNSNWPIPWTQHMTSPESNFLGTTPPAQAYKNNRINDFFRGHGPSTLAKKLMDRVSAKIPAPRPLPPNVASPLGPNSLSTTLQHPKAHIKKVPPPRPPPPRFASKFGAQRYLSKKTKSPRKQVKRQAHRVAPSTSTSHSGSSTEPMPTSPGEISSASGVSAEMPFDSSTVTAAREPYANASRDLSFGELFNSTPGISLPQSSWAVHRTDAEGVRDIVFIDAADDTQEQATALRWCSIGKALHVKSDMTVQAYVFGKRVGTAAFGLKSVSINCIGTGYYAQRHEQH